MPLPSLRPSVKKLRLQLRERTEKIRHPIATFKAASQSAEPATSAKDEETAAKVWRAALDALQSSPEGSLTYLISCDLGLAAAVATRLVIKHADHGIAPIAALTAYCEAEGNEMLAERIIDQLVADAKG
ncbi:uncharacterized protein KY384_006607 [Bacidia gigantensis]|uniref:uncharacterized protein n=1 Tax=Bacidia gigantensis TaxID=2732470 RepID=UPI001D042ECE|nr:uncharacterized protein KY384_006607 [Bacidia gigantensis]KAG8528918.1 hypothetical protein KY384_006607 [Bacidia gigantensis]